MYYTVYKITNKVNGKIYIGKHKTNDLDDGYFGSGKVLKRAIKKHGIENFIKEYIEIFDNEEDMNLLESKLVNPTFVANSSTYNLKLGGTGGFDFINNNKNLIVENNKDTYKNIAKKASIIHFEKLKTDEQYYNNYCNKLKEARKIQAISELFTFHGRLHSEDTKRTIGEKNSVHQSASKNSQFGTCWMTDGNTNKKVKKEDIEKMCVLGFRLGRVMNLKQETI